MSPKPFIWSSTGMGAPPGQPPGEPPGPPASFTPPPPPSPPAGPLRDGPAWERRSMPLDIGAMFSTIGAVLIDAPRTFRTMIRDGGLGSPLLYLIILGTVCGWIGLAWGAAFDAVFSDLMPSDMGPPGFPLADLMASGALTLVQAVMMPAIVLVVFFIWSAILHLFLLLVGGAEQPFETTARVVAYTSGSTSVFQLVPFCGNIVGLFWGVAVTIIGLAEAHETTMGRAVAAVLLPFVLCCLCVAMMVMLVALGIAQMPT